MIQMSHSQRDGVITFIVSGQIRPGSEGNSVVGDIVNEIEGVISDIYVRSVIIDISSLNFGYCDAIAGLWIFPVKKGLDCSIIITGDKEKIVKSLMSITISANVVVRV